MHFVNNSDSSMDMLLSVQKDMEVALFSPT